MKSCPECAEQVQEAARLCRYCGYRFDVADASETRTTTAICDFCDQPASRINLLPDTGRVSKVALSCERHEPGGDAYRLDEPVPLLRRRIVELRPGIVRSLGWTDIQPVSSSPKAGVKWTSSGIGVAVIVGLLYFSGTFDKPLFNVGLNFHPCIQNAFGATFCGDDAKRYCREVVEPLTDATGGGLRSDCEEILGK
jgi:hypothetical protein